MIINFNPFYTSGAFVTDSDCGLGVTYMGPYALLCELELRGGQSRAADDGTQRAIRYMQAMGKALDEDNDIFFAKSFQRDDLGTAEIVLRWRDSIRRYGWTPFTDTSSEKLLGLAEVESHFSMDGPADRWRAILELAGTKAILSPSDSINVTCAKEDLEPMLQELFTLIESKGTKITYKEDEEVSITPEILSFKNDTQLNEWLSRQSLTAKDVIVGPDRGMLNDMLYALGKPLIGNSEDGIGPVMRIFTLGLSLFTVPVNIIDLLAYLQLPKNPLNALHVKIEREGKPVYYRSLARILADLLCNQGGISDDWKKNIEAAVFDYQGNRLDDEKIAELRCFVGMWENTDKTTGLVSKTAVGKFASLLGRWAKGHFSKDGKETDDLEVQFHALASFCDTFKILLDGQGEKVKADKVSMWAGRIICPITLAGEFTRKGSLNVIDRLGNIHSAPERLVWVSAETKTDYGYEFSFLSKLDVEELESHGVMIPARELSLRANRNIAMNALAKSKTAVTIATCERLGGDLTTPNLIIAELTQRFGIKPDTDPFIVPAKECRLVNQSSGKKVELQIPPCNLDEYGKVQSASSIEKIINHPFDYYLTYILGLTGYGTDGIADEIVIRGNIAHNYMKDLGDSEGHDVAKMIAEHDGNFDERFDKITRKCGILFLSEEKAIVYRDYKAMIKESITTLLKLISEMRLTIVGQEKLVLVDMEPFGKFKGYIDCLLQDKKGDYVIFDFKYGWQRYYDKVNEGRAIQLALYKKAIEIERNAKVSFCGYYSFLTSQLYSADTPVCPTGMYEPMEPIRNNDTFTQVCNSFLYRKKQFSEGILEEADGLPLKDLEYVSEQMARDLLHLEYTPDGACKQYAYGYENMILKGDLS